MKIELFWTIGIGWAKKRVHNIPWLDTVGIQRLRIDIEDFEARGATRIYRYGCLHGGPMFILENVYSFYCGTTVVVTVSGMASAHARENMHRWRKSGIFVVLSEITSFLRLFCFPLITRKNFEPCVLKGEPWTIERVEILFDEWSGMRTQYKNAMNLRVQRNFNSVAHANGIFH